MDKKIIDSLPSSPGVYVFKKEKHYLYIGKSVNIKARVKSHFENARISQKEAQIVSLSDSIDWITVDSDFKALLLESSLIKKYSPKYNSLLKDGKSYLYLKITVKEKYPRFYLPSGE
jgi:excinuclease ABC subunit C